MGRHFGKGDRVHRIAQPAREAGSAGVLLSALALYCHSQRLLERLHKAVTAILVIRTDGCNRREPSRVLIRYELLVNVKINRHTSFQVFCVARPVVAVLTTNVYYRYFTVDRRWSCTGKLQTLQFIPRIWPPPVLVNELFYEANREQGGMEILLRPKGCRDANVDHPTSDAKGREYKSWQRQPEVTEP
jgi:hypothetical protein